ncbi:POT family [Musa troglodytarum]|nr:POT family [Musa troglodytarum]
MFAATVLVYVQDSVSRGWGYGISAATVVVLLLGTGRYQYSRPQGSPLTVTWRVFLSASEKLASSGRSLRANQVHRGQGRAHRMGTWHILIGRWR